MIALEKRPESLFDLTNIVDAHLDVDLDEWAKTQPPEGTPPRNDRRTLPEAVSKTIEEGPNLNAIQGGPGKGLRPWRPLGGTGRRAPPGPTVSIAPQQEGSLDKLVGLHGLLVTR